MSYGASFIDETKCRVSAKITEHKVCSQIKCHGNAYKIHHLPNTLRISLVYSSRIR